MDPGFSLSTPMPGLKCVVVIPAFAEESLIPTLRFLEASCAFVQHAEVIIVINQGEDVSKHNQVVNDRCFREICAAQFEGLPIHVLFVEKIPVKIAGVGLARKIGMDEAAKRLASAGSESNGIIINLDADCTVSKNYLNAIVDGFASIPEAELLNIHFEHYLDQTRSVAEREAIIQYELHLRYFIEMQRWLDLPYACHTVGSAFAVLASSYRKIGGMNKRKAGEDFYFIHKFTKKGTARDLNQCIVYPSGRTSFRVPFGTGKAVENLIKDDLVFKTYNPKSFVDLKELVQRIDYLYSNSYSSLKPKLSKPVNAYLVSQTFDTVIEKIKSNCTSLISFRKAFFQWFDAFRLMKCLHFIQDHYYPNVPVHEALESVGGIVGIEYSDKPEKLLLSLRAKHKLSKWTPRK